MHSYVEISPSYEILVHKFDEILIAESIIISTDNKDIVHVDFKVKGKKWIDSQGHLIAPRMYVDGVVYTEEMIRKLVQERVTNGV